MEFVGFNMIFIIALSLMGSIVNSKESSEFRLPTNFMPVSYRLNVTTYLDDKFMFEGVVDIQITCVEVTDTIVLHSSSLNIDTKSVVVANGGKNVSPVDSVSFDPVKEFMYVKSTVNFKLNDTYVLTIPFNGNLTDNLVGYYRSSYVDKEYNQTRWLAVTQFKPTYTRKGFPCFDEPSYKATFKIILGHKKGLTSISNMKIMNESSIPSKPDYIFDEFEESIPIPPCLVAYMVSDFVYIEADSRDDKVKFRIIVRKNAANLTELAKKVGPSVFEYIEDYLDEKSPFPKQDMAALPNSLYGGIENWGLTTYVEEGLLSDPSVDTIDKVYFAVDTIAHEIVNQWFGGLVTIKWWNNLWLKEGCATYLAPRGVDSVYPDWNYIQLNTVTTFIEVAEIDCLQSSRPLLADVGSPDEINQIFFDTMTYSKGSCLLYMVNMFLTENTFKQSIKNYLKKHKFSYIEPDDLWSSLTEEAHHQGTLDSNLTVKQIMDTWTSQAGLPLLKVVRDYSAGTVTLSQERFLTIKSNGTDEKSCWWIPITTTTSKEADFNQTKPKSWLNCENNNFTTPLAKDNEWVIYNLQMAGLFRVLYDTQNWMCIISTLNDSTKYKTIHTLNRVQLITDSLTFSRVGELDYGITFQLLKYLKYEDEYLPWSVALDTLVPIYKLIKRTRNEGAFQNYMQRMLSSIYGKFKDMTVELNGLEEIHFKTRITAEACRFEIKDCTEQGVELFSKWMKSSDPDNNKILPRELKYVIYKQGIINGGVKEWDFLLERYQHSTVKFDKWDIIDALGCSSDTMLLNRFLNLSLDISTIRPQDAPNVFRAVAIRNIGFDVAKNFLYCRIADISEYCQAQGDCVGKYVEVIGSQMITKEELDDMQLFIKKSSGYLKEADSAINNAIQNIKTNIEWISMFSNKVVKTWL